MPSLFERLGGEAAVQAAVDLFYDKVLADPLVSRFFERLDMKAQVKKQIAFMSRAFDAPAAYHGRDLREAHAKLVLEGLSDVHFDAVVRHLTTSLRELEVAQPLVDEVLSIVERTRPEVLGR